MGCHKQEKELFLWEIALTKSLCGQKHKFVKMDKNATTWMEWNYRTVNMAVSDLPWPKGNYFSHRANSQMRGPRIEM